MSEQDNNPKDSFEDPFMTRLGVLFEYVDQTQNNLSALFVALVEEEDVSASDEGEADNLANADTVTQQGQLGFSQGIAGIQYQDTLAAAGLAFNPDVFSGDLQVADGEKFVQTLRAMPTGNETLQKGLNSILSSFLWRTAYAYVPDRDEMLPNTYEQ